MEALGELLKVIGWKRSRSARMLHKNSCYAPGCGVDVGPAVGNGIEMVKSVRARHEQQLKEEPSTTLSRSCQSPGGMPKDGLGDVKLPEYNAELQDTCGEDIRSDSTHSEDISSMDGDVSLSISDGVVSDDLPDSTNHDSEGQEVTVDANGCGRLGGDRGAISPCMDRGDDIAFGDSDVSISSEDAAIDGQVKDINVVTVERCRGKDVCVAAENRSHSIVESLSRLISTIFATSGERDLDSGDAVQPSQCDDPSRFVEPKFRARERAGISNKANGEYARSSAIPDVHEFSEDSVDDSDSSKDSVHDITRETRGNGTRALVYGNRVKVAYLKYLAESGHRLYITSSRPQFSSYDEHVTHFMAPVHGPTTGFTKQLAEQKISRM